MAQSEGVIPDGEQGLFTEVPELEFPYYYNFNTTYNWAGCASFDYTFW